MNKRSLIIDSFAGGGGASTGIEMALGRSPDIAINHNEAALALHAANHPETLHLSENIFKVDPLDHVAGKHVGLAWFSPDCKHFSKAKGGKPVERNIRDLAWIIVLWAERAKPDVIIMENVEEWKDWGPLLDTDKGLMPCPNRRGETFQKWCKAMRRAGYKLQHRELRACDYGAPTIRKRLFVVARRDGNPIVWPAPTHGAPNSPEVLSGKRLPWRTAAEIIDWSLPCPSIFDTSAEVMFKHSLRAVRPLADATMARVARGMKRYVLDAERPFIVNLTHGARLEDLDQPFNTITGANRGEKAVVAPSVIRFNSGATGQDAREPLSTITANSFIKRPGGAAPLGIIAPVLTAAQHGGSIRDVRDPHHTITASKKDQNSVIVPVLVQTGYGERDGQEPRSLDPHVPLGTIVAGGVKHAAVIPNLMSMKGSDRRDSSIETPHPTVLAGGGHSALVSAFIAQHNNDSRREGGVNPGRSADEPVSTVTQTGSQQGLVSAFVSRQFGASVGHGIDEPSATVTAGVNKSALVAPFMQAYYGTGDGGEENQPCRTITTKDRHGHVEASISAPPFTSDQHARARQVADFMRSHGFWDEREFVTVSITDELFVIVDIGMRMLSPRELYSAQGFPANYKIDQDADGNVFSKSVQVSCVGNSVSPPVAAALVAANCSDLIEYREAAE